VEKHLVNLDKWKHIGRTHDDWVSTSSQWRNAREEEHYPVTRAQMILERLQDIADGRKKQEEKEAYLFSRMKYMDDMTSNFPLQRDLTIPVEHRAGLVKPKE
jgi:hypothetical protein